MTGAKEVDTSHLRATLRFSLTLNTSAFTRPDISFAVNKMPQYMQTPTKNYRQL